MDFFVSKEHDLSLLQKKLRIFKHAFIKLNLYLNNK